MQFAEDEEQSAGAEEKAIELTWSAFAGLLYDIRQQEAKNILLHHSSADQPQASGILMICFYFLAYSYTK